MNNKQQVQQEGQGLTRLMSENAAMSDATGVMYPERL